MTGTLQPLAQNFQIVDERGFPTIYFIQWAQQRQIDISGAITAQQALDIAVQYLADHPLLEGTGIDLTNDGNIGQGVTISANVQEILNSISTTRGTVLFRGSTAWQALAPGTSGQFLKTNGAGADPEWAAGGGGGGGGSGSIFTEPYGEAFHPNLTNASTFSAGFFGGRFVYVPRAGKIKSVKFLARANSTSVVTPAIYSLTATGTIGSLIASGPPVSGITAGMVELPLSADYVVAANTLLVVGVVCQTAALPIARSTMGQTAFYATASSTPTTSPTFTLGTQDWGAMFPVVEEIIGSGGGSLPCPPIRNSAIQANASAASYVLPIPSGAVAGDFCVIFHGGGFGPATITAPATALWDTFQQGATNWGGTLFSKILSAADIAAGSVTVTPSGAFNSVASIVVFQGAAQLRYPVLELSPRTIAIHAPGTGVLSSTQSCAYNTVDDCILVFASNRAASNNTSTYGTLRNTVNAANGSAALYAEENPTAGGQSTTLAYSATGTGRFELMLCVRGPN